MPGRLAGKIALITGTAGGQGRAAALLFTREGAKVVGCDTNAAGAEETLAMVRKAGGEMSSMAPVDLSREEEARKWVADAAAVYGGIDILYNNAATGRAGPFATLSTAAWHETIRNELDLVFYATQAAWPHLIARGGGSVINVASIIANRTSDLPMSARGAAKSGVVGLTVHMAIEGGPRGIRVNCISPGLIATPAVDDFLKDPHDSIQKQVRTSPLGRVGRAEDVVPLALFLASDEAAYITGVNVVVDGGQTLGIAMSFGEGEPAASPAPRPDWPASARPVKIAMPEGTADSFFVTPEGHGPWPGVLLYTDIMGVRPVFVDMAKRLAAAGFAVLLPNLFYRTTAPFDPPLSVKKSADFARLMELMPTLTRERIERDSAAYLKTLREQPEVAGGPMACVGYCMSGAMAIWTAHAQPDEIAAAASFHGGHLSTAASDSPDKLAAQTKAHFYFGMAETDAFMKPAMIARLRETLDRAGTDYRAEVYPGTFHGFTIPDAGYDEAAAERHWRELVEFLRRTVGLGPRA